jgi:hypothetical protein
VEKTKFDRQGAAELRFIAGHVLCVRCAIIVVGFVRALTFDTPLATHTVTKTGVYWKQ